MKSIPSTIRLNAIIVRKHLPSALVVQRVFKLRKAYDRKANKAALVSQE